ncbi:MAG: reprolysin-like metallopeptidase [Chitinophagaceae bacterium]
MRKISTKLRLILGLVVLAPICASAQQRFFSDINEAAIPKVSIKRVIVPGSYKTLRLDTAAVIGFLRSLPSESTIINRSTTPLITLPMPDGSVARFHIWESSAMAPKLAAQFSHIKTFTGQGIDDPTATIKIDWTELGFHAQILSSATGAIFIDPYAQGTEIDYISYYKKDFVKTGTFNELPPIKFSPKGGAVAAPNSLQFSQCIGSQLRTYRLAVACTGEYAVAATGMASPTVGQALSAIVTTVNRVNGVYEKEIDIRIVLVASETNVVFTNAATDPFNGNNDATILINESQAKIDQLIGNANYDMGHTFSTGGGGLSGLGIICQTGQKASSITGSSSPVGDPYDIDYVAHEMGHALGAQHTFNSALSNCGGNGSSTTNTEPGSGTTIMAYAGICGADDIQPHSDPQFHAASLDEISAYTFSSTGTTCGTLTATGNTPPVVNAGGNYIIPKSTTFFLTGSATDADSDPLTYSWEQIDIGGLFGTWNNPTGNAPLFRSFAPVTSPTRYFPKLSDQVNNVTTIGELLPSYARTMRFRLTARDNRAGGGGICFDSTSIKIDATAAPFVVTSPTTTGVVWAVNDFKTITWNPSTTALAPIGCTNVTIQLSTNGGISFPITLVASTPNDGMEEIQVPNNTTSRARIRVMAVGNIFYDISNNDFTIQTSPTADFVFNTPALIAACSDPNPVATLKTGALGGFSNTISLAATNIPSGTSVTFGTNPLAPGSNTTLTLNGANTLAAGTYNITVTGTASGVADKVRTVSFLVGSTAVPPATLASPAAYAIGVKLSPMFVWAIVAGAVSYTLEISTTPDFSAISQTISGIPSNSYTLIIPLAENTNYYWRVRTANSCGVGAPSAGPIFKTGVSVCNTFTSTNVPKTIPTSGTVTSTLVIPGGSAVTITDLNVLGLVGTHTWSADLTFTLKSPANTSVTLIQNVCDDGVTRYQDFNLNLDDEASATIPCNYIGGITVLPQSPLSAFDGESSAGTWTLTILDSYAGDGGSLTGWKLNFCNLVPSPIRYTFTGNGNWDVASNWANNAIPPANLPANCAIDINPAGSGQCILNIPSQHILTGATFTVKTGKMIVVPGSVIVQ